MKQIIAIKVVYSDGTEQVIWQQEQQTQRSRLDRETFKLISEKARLIFEETDHISYVEFLKRIKESTGVDDNAINTWISSSERKGFIKVIEHAGERVLIFIKPWWRTQKTKQRKPAKVDLGKAIEKMMK